MKKQTRREFLVRSVRGGGALALLSAVPSWVLAQQRHSLAYRERAFYTMGSVATIRAYGESIAQIDHAVTRVITEFTRLDRLLSIYDPQSDLSRINGTAGQNAVRVHPEVLSLVQEIRRRTLETGGTFDMTVEPLMRLWGFRGKERNEPPSDQEIRLALDAVGQHHIDIDEREGTIGLRHPAALLDSGGWGVGYAVDRAVEILKAEGIESAFVNHSGDAYALGVPPEEESEQGWGIAVPNPLSPERMMFTMKLRDKAVSTSGNYRNFLKEGNSRIGHILDPRTGHPAGKAISTTVISASALEADVLSTTLFAVAPEQWRGILDERGQPDLIGVLPDCTIVEHMGRATGHLHLQTHQPFEE